MLPPEKTTVKIILFDLGDTLEHDDVLLPGALTTLKTLSKLKLPDGTLLPLGLISDFDMPTKPEDIPGIRANYLQILKTLGILRFFKPADQRITLSTDVGVFKPDEKIFRAAVDKISLPPFLLDTPSSAI